MRNSRKGSAIALAACLSLGAASGPAFAGKHPDSWSTWEECQWFVENLPHRGKTVWVATCVPDAEGRWYIVHHKVPRTRVSD